jgi:N-acetylglucosaminylphosphatidylinositol deacetylase
MRKVELKGSCDALGISPDRCVALDQKDLQDNPKVWWSEDAIIADVKEYVEKWKVDLVSIGFPNDSMIMILKSLH